jgi:hypothetical protein
MLAAARRRSLPREAFRARDSTWAQVDHHH